MRETIRYYYNIYPNEIKEIDNGCYFYFNGFKYYFIKYVRNVNEIKLLADMSNDLYNKNILVDTFILSKDNSFFVSVDEDIYVMLRVNSIENDSYNLKDLVYFNNLLISKDNLRINEDWASLWMKKVDEFEMEMSEINTEYPTIQESFDYYVGLAENAISYFKDTSIDEDMNYAKINLNHKRIDTNAFSGFINNPLTFTFDYEVRDVAEYIKSKFFEGILDFNEVEDFVLDSNLSRVSMRLLFSRLLYPSYYFDAVKKIFIYDESEDILSKYIEKIDAYEDLMIDIFNLINRKFNIPPIEWIINRN